MPARSLARAPKQERSRASFERILEAATELLKEHGPDDFTLNEVSRRAEASIGSIYGRVDSKDDLIRIVHASVMERMDAEAMERLNPARWEGVPLPELVPALVAEWADQVQREAPLLRAFQLRSRTDSIMAARGKASHDVALARFREVLLQRRDEIRHPDPEFAVDYCFTVASAMLWRLLGFGFALAVRSEPADLQRSLEELGRLCSLYLTCHTRTP
jgi:AcrR family transcriptional regulator